MDVTPKNIQDEQDRMEQARRDYEPLKQLNTALAYPARSDQMDYHNAYDDTATEGQPNTKSRRIYDSTAIRSLDIWGNGILGYYMPANDSWFRQRMAKKKMNESKQIRQWLQDTDEHLRYTLARCNYYDQKGVALRDAACIGDAYTYIDNDAETGKLICMVPHPREMWHRLDWWGRPTGIHHKFSKTLREIEGEFGRDSLSEVQQTALEKSPNQKAVIIHAIYKNTDYTAGKVGVRNMKWQHYYLNVAAKKIILQTGTATLNPIPWSLNRPSHELYGRGIVSQMLVDILTCNFMSRDLLIASQTAARPPMLISSALKNKLDMGAGAVNFMGRSDTAGLKMGDLVTRLLDSSGYPFAAEHYQKWTQLVENRFGVPLFEAMQRMNAMGKEYKNRDMVRGVQAEQTVLMAPFLGTLSNNTDTEFERIYQIEAEQGRAPAPPQEVLDAQDGRTEIQYVGPLFQLLQQYYETGNLLSAISNIQAAASVVPQAMAVVEGDSLMRKILRAGNAPEEIILDEGEVQELRAIQAQREEAAMSAELMAKSSKAIPNLGRKIEADSVLSKMMKAA